MIRCQSCNCENSENTPFCTNCGSPLKRLYKTCPNGHNYDANLSNCPHCPTGVSSTNSSDSTRIMGASRDVDKTRIMGAEHSPATNTQQTAERRDRTIIMGSAFPKSDNVDKPSNEALRKLVGWLVTFDIQPTGIDYRLYTGRHIIGKSGRSDIIIQIPGVSEEHAILLYREGKFILQDNLSSNGTFVNGKLIEDKIELHDNDIITIANIKLKLKTT